MTFVDQIEIGTLWRYPAGFIAAALEKMLGEWKPGVVMLVVHVDDNAKDDWSVGQRFWDEFEGGIPTKVVIS